MAHGKLHNKEEIIMPSIVKYQVERRPISKSGKVYRGTGYGDYVLTLTHPENIKGVSETGSASVGTSKINTFGASPMVSTAGVPLIPFPLGRISGSKDDSGNGRFVAAHAYFVPAEIDSPSLIKEFDFGTSAAPDKVSATAVSHVQEQNGEPWLVHSTHFSIDSALESAAPLAGAVGTDNVRIVKVLSHTTTFKLN